MIIKTDEYKDFLELVASINNSKNEFGLTLYSNNEVAPNFSFTGNEEKLIEITLVYNCSSFNLVFNKRYSKEEYIDSNIESNISLLREIALVKQFETITIDYSKGFVSVKDVHGDL